MLVEESVWKGPGERWKESDISMSSLYAPTSLIWVDCALFIASRDGELGVIVRVGEEEFGEKKDRGWV